MVAPDDPSRAQLLLVGSVVLAVVILGLVVVVNSLFVTQTTIQSEASPQVEEAREFDYESRKGARTIIARLSHRHRNATPSELGDIIQRNLTVYSQLMAESYATSRGEYVNITYHNDSSTFGKRIVQAADGNFTTTGDTSGQQNWWVVRQNDRQNLSWFTMNVDAESTSTEPVVIRVQNDASPTNFVDIAINRTDVGAGSHLWIESDVQHGDQAAVRCESSRGQVLLDLVEGTAFNDDCQFNGTSEIDPPYSIRVRDGTNVVTKYGIAVNDTPTRTGPSRTYPQCDATVDASTPCLSPTVWEANVSTQFVGSEITYGNEFNVSVYGEGR